MALIVLEFRHCEKLIQSSSVFYKDFITLTRLGDIHNIYARTAGWGRRFEFGYHDKKRENQGTFDSPTLHSACKTTEESPVGSRFRSCDTIEVSVNKMIINILICNFLLKKIK